MKSTILVTGGAGFIGSNFVRYVLRKDERTKGPFDFPRLRSGQVAQGRRRTRIINLDKLTYSGNISNLKDIEHDPRYKFVKGDICDRKLVDRLAKGCDAIINFAAESHVDRSIKYPDEFIRTNVFGAQVLLDAARKHSIKRFIQISTDEVYGSLIRGYFHEESPLKPNSPYSASKAAADLLARSYFTTYRLPVIIVRSCNNFGPYQYPEKVIPLFVTNAFENKKVPLYADGSNVREWIYVEDNCDAINLVLDSGKAGEIYNIGSGSEIKNIELTKKILALAGRDKGLIKFVKDRPGHDKRYALNFNKLKRLGWKPKHNFTEALEKTVLWYKENGTWWKRLKKKSEKKFW